VLLLAAVLVTVSANPGWLRLRRVLVVLWLLSVAATLLSVFSIWPDLRRWHRTTELLTMLFTHLYLCVITWNPATHTARMLAMFQAVVGVFYVAAVVALFVGTYTSQRRS
jgi:hypothetical protein